MLVLTRMPNERIIIGDKDICVKIVKVRGSLVTLQITSKTPVTVKLPYSASSGLSPKVDIGAYDFDHRN
jgi:hypothetical protein